MAFDRRSGRPIACDMVRVDANSVSVEVLSEERYIGSVVQEAKPPKQKNVRVRSTLKIFLFPLTQPCFAGLGRSVGNLFFLTKNLKLDTD